MSLWLNRCPNTVWKQDENDYLGYGIVQELVGK